MFFFFQAEDGIRDLVRSRGLGDVYKRQAAFSIIEPTIGVLLDRDDAIVRRRLGLRHVSFSPMARSTIDVVATGITISRPIASIYDASQHGVAVSYTHLTLPTSDLV